MCLEDEIKADKENKEKLFHYNLIDYNYKVKSTLMTTAHRPTWHTARGGTEQGGNVLINPSRAYSAKDQPSHNTLKTRENGQGNVFEQDQIDFKAQLLE